MISHKDALNLILDYTCSNKTDDEGYTVFVIDLHCKEARVSAKLLHQYEYEIKSVVIVDKHSGLLKEDI